MADKRYAELTKELRAFHGTEGFKCTNPQRKELVCRRTALLEDFAQSHPEADAFALRRKIYSVVKETFAPVILPHSPFYCELGINGGWSYILWEKSVQFASTGIWLLEHLTLPVFRDASPEAWERFTTRRNMRFFSCCGPYYDSIHNNPATARLLKTGFKGIYEEAIQTRPLCKTDKERDWLETAIQGLETVRSLSEQFGEAARRRLPLAADEDERRCLERIVESAPVTPWEPPRTFYEALNLCWFVREITGELDGTSINSLGRPDAWLIDFYNNDIAAGRLTEDEAYDLICRFLLMGDLVYDRDFQVGFGGEHENENTLTLGGCDENGREVFNDVTRLFLKAYREQDFIYPKPHCRFSASSSSEYLRLIGDDILRGHGIYQFINDDCLIPALVKTGHSLEDARNYCCTGCWDIVVPACEDNAGGNYFNLAQILDATIHLTDEELARAKFRPRRIDHSTTFEEVFRALQDNTKEIFVDLLKDQHDYGRLAVNAAPAPMHSACCFDCLKNRKDFTEGGQRYNPHAVSLSFFATYIDSLLAIKSVCFDKKICTLDDFLAAVRNNWNDAEPLRAEVLKAPHWGDGRPETETLARRVVDELFEAMADIPNERGGHYQLGIWVYRELKSWGHKTHATPDGRHDGDELSQSLCPSHFRNDAALTTVLKSLSSLDLTRFAGNSVTNIFIERNRFSPEVLESVLRTFARLNLQLLQLNCVDSDELEEARKHPEKYQHLIVRLCGFSAKFVSLCPEWQQQIIDRHKY